MIKEVNKSTEIITEQGLTKALDKVFKILPSLISILIGFTTIAYLIGWIQAKSYFTGFNASWIVSELSSFDILTFSWLSLSQLMFFIYLGITDLMVNKNRYKTTFFILKHGWYFIIIIYVANLLLANSQLTILKNIIGNMSLPLLFTVYAAASFELLLINLQKNEFKWELLNIYVIYGIVLFGFYLLPTQIGKENSQRDSDFNKTKLNKIFLKNDNRDNLRLLKSNGDLFYILELDSIKHTPKIKVVDYNEVKFVE